MKKSPFGHMLTSTYVLLFQSNSDMLVALLHFLCCTSFKDFLRVSYRQIPSAWLPQTVAHSQQLMIIIILVGSLLLSLTPHVISQGEHSPAGRSQLYWVAANSAQCGNLSNGSNCGTLDEYWRKGANFSLSDTTWIFLHGEHIAPTYWKLEIVQASNVTIQGEEKCATGVEECVLVIRNDCNNRVTMICIEITAVYTILVTESSHVTLENLKVIGYSRMMAASVFTFRVLVKEASHIIFEHLDVAISPNSIRIEATDSVCIRAVDFQNVELEITDPTGDYMVIESVLSSTYVQTHPSACSQTAAESCSFDLNINECIFRNEGTVDFTVEDSKQSLQMAKKINYHSIRLSIANSTMEHFLSARSKKMSILIRNYPTQLCAVEVSNVTFRTNEVRLEMPLSFITENATNLSSADRSVGAHVLIDGCNFLGTAQGITIALHNSINTGELGTFSSWDSTTATEWTTMKHPEIIIANTNFYDCHFTQVAHTIGVQIFGNMHDSTLFVNNHRRLLMIQNSTFKKEPSKNPYRSNTFIAAIALTDLQGYRVVLAGGNYITSNQGYGLVMYNSQVELHGYNEISKNTHGSQIGGGGIYMSSHSQLLLTPGTVLNVTENTGYPYGGGIYISHYDRSYDVQTMSLSAFLDCYVEFNNCPGWCFFQFINSDGQSVNASELAEHNATVLLSNNTASHGGDNVFNGHFQNCSLQTADVNGTLPASRQLTLDVFHQYPPMDEEPIPSYPYVICLCIDGELNCIRNHTLVIHTYPLQNLIVSAHVMGDWQHLLPVKLMFYDNGATHTYKLGEKNYTEVYTLRHSTPGSSYYFQMQASLAAEDVFNKSNERYCGILTKNLVVKVFNSCSPGLVYKQHKCTCSTILKHHMFTCTQRTTTATYRADQPHYWIGKKGNLIFLSCSCPAFFCNSAVLQSGMTLDESTQNQQCIDDRQGLLCSECPSGYSSVFGSYNCKECSSVWLLQLPLHALGGIFIVAILFLFNLTLLQGTILGVVLYTNIMGIMGDFLQEHAWGPLFFLLSVINLQPGVGVCLYDGMDEFWKALLQFAFPFYLFTLLILIIIVTHKCGYRMFRRARFIARRAVPVLATIMVLMYTSLVNAVITPLRYTTLYDVDTAQGETVWLYQPSLPFFGGQHLVIGILSIAVTVLYLIPFTFTMLFGDLMRRYFHKLWFSHFMDVLHGGFRWPLGFWIGLRLLVRVILVVTHIFTSADVAAYCTFVTTGTLLVVQLLVKPFRDPDQFRNTIDLQVPLTFGSKCKRQVKKFVMSYPTPLFDLLYLLNILAAMATIILDSIPRTDREIQKQLSAAGINILIILALVQFAVILVYHAYNFFPVPEKARSCAQSCWSTMCAIPSMLKDTQCCRRRPKEEEEPRRSPIPILILRPPEIDESYESESDGSSYPEQPPPEQVEMRESSLQEPLLTHGR